MIKYFCDICDQQINKPKPQNRVKKRYGNLEIEITVAVNNVWNGGHACETCVQAAVLHGSPSDAPAPAVATRIDAAWTTVDPRIILTNPMRGD